MTVFQPLSVGQEAMWFLNRTVPDSAAYNVVLALRIRSTVDVASLDTAITLLAGRHEILRSTFVEHEGKPVRAVMGAEGVRLAVRDARDLSEATLRARVAEAAAEPFDLRLHGPLRALLFRQDSAEAVLLLVTHHIATDFVSQGVLLLELLDIYAALSSGHEPGLPALKGTYADFVAQEQRMLASPRRALLEEYWREACAGAPTVLELPADRPRPLWQSFTGATHEVTLDAGLVKRVEAASKRQSVTQFTFLLSAFQTLIHRCTGERDFLLACPTMPDMIGKMKGTTGYFVNPVVVRARCETDTTFRDLLRSTNAQVTGAISHRDYPFPMLIQLLDVPRDPSRSPLVQVAFSLQAADLSGDLLDLHAQGERDGYREIRYRGIRVAAFDVPQQEGQFDLSLEVVRTSSSVRAVFKYRDELFDEATIARLARQFVRVIESTVEPADRTLSELEFLDQDECAHLLALGTGETHEPAAACAHDLVTTRTTKSPDAVALRADGVAVTYAELDRRSNRLAALLRASDVSPGDRVGVHLPRGPELAMAVLGIMKAGATYLPLDRSNPSERIAFMLDEAAAPVMLSTQDSTTRHDGIPVRVLYLDQPGLLDAQSEVPVEPRSAPDSAYVIYTSGSSGRPKGVLVGHRGLVSLADWQADQFDLGPHSVVLQYASIGFDASVWELFMALGSGATLYSPPPDARLAGAHLAEVIAAGGVTHVTLPPSVLATLAPEDVPTVTHVVAAGEECPTELAQVWSDKCVFYNAYGPTETTVCASAYRYLTDGRRPAIGRPLHNFRIYLTDERLRLVPLGAVGEIVVSGTGVAQGYLNRPELTADRFVDDPFHPGAQAYRTGDLARWRHDGELEFLGRRDQQVKVRGFRIELGEVEAVLSGHPGVRHAVAIVRGRDSNKSLVAYVVPRETESVLTADELSEWAGRTLPSYLVPTRFELVSELPLTRNGKVDRDALTAASAAGAQRTPARTPIERTLASILGEELSLPDVGIHDDFFALGGHSLLAARLAFRVREAFGVELALSQILQRPTVAGMARILKDDLAHSATLPSITPAPVDAYRPFPLTDVQQAYVLGRRSDFALGGVSAHGYFEIDGPGLDPGRLSDAWNTIVRRHRMLRAVFDNESQWVQPEVPPYEIRVHDHRESAPTELAAHLARVRAEMSHQVLAADQWPLFDIRLTLLAGGRSKLHLSFDGLVADGASLRRVMQEWAGRYDDPTVTLPEVAVEFRDYVLAEHAIEGTEPYETSRRYWQARLAGLPAGPQLPVSRVAEAAGAPRFECMSARLDPATWSALRRRSAAEGLSPSNALLAAYTEILASWSKSRHFTVNLTLFNRLPLHERLDELVGDFTSITLLEVDLRRAASFRKKARALQARLWEDLDHRYYSGIKVQRDWVRSSGSVPTGPSMPVVFTSVLDDRGHGWGFERFGTLVTSTSQTPQVWLDHVVVERDGGVDLVWNVVPALFPDGVLEDMFAGYQALLGRLATDERFWSQEYNDLRAPTHIREHTAANATNVLWERSPLLHEPFFERAVERPDKVAVIADDRTLTYRELARHADAVAACLRNLDLKPGALVAVMMDKSWQQVAAVLGIMRAGFAYLPVNVRLPPARRALLLREAGVRVAVTRKDNKEELEPNGDPEAALPEGLIVVVADELPHAGDGSAKTVASVDDLAYVIYTSGSTGKPKGVMITHRAAMNTIQDVNHRFGITGDDTVFALSSLSFDLSVYDIFGVLAVGGTMVLPDHAQEMDPAHWLRLVARHRVTVWNSVPALLRLAVQWAETGERDSLASLRFVMLSGDWIPLTLPDDIRACSPEVQVIAMGGATEASIWSNFHRVGEQLPGWPSVPYGKPLANQNFHVLDEVLQPRPTWVPGELFIGGSGLASGYLGDEKRTAEKFIVHPATGQRLYRTGDWGRYRPGGDLQFLGREDLQVKMNGNRVELGEIEATLERHEEVKNAVVTAPQTGADRRLVAYVVCEPVGSESRTLHIRRELADAEYDARWRAVADATGHVDAVRAWSRAWPVGHRRLLELGDDSAENASALLPMLLDDDVSYLLTEESPAALERSRKQLGQFDRIEFAVLDPDQPVEQQGQSAHGYDLVLARHLPSSKAAATALLTTSLTLLAQGGLLLLADAGQGGSADEIMERVVLLTEAGFVRVHAGESPMVLAQAPAAVSEPDPERIRRYLRKHLPPYMIPTTILPLSTMPLSANGKVDRARLPSPDLMAKQQDFAEVSVLHTDTQRRLAEIWSARLNVSVTGLNSNFFMLGGDSLIATRILSQLKEEFSVSLDIGDIFNSPTIGDLAALVDQRYHTAKMVPENSGEWMEEEL